jgi:exodeoxyribonuclease V beta subunit
MSAPRVARPSVLRRVPLDRHAVIEASAGTGKTFTLEHLVVELVLAGDVPIDRVLVVTFTEKATNELRVRVRKTLEDLLAGRGTPPTEAELAAGDFWTLDDAASQKLARALHAFDGATIATIHAFCQRVLRENAFASGRLFEEQQVDGRDSFRRALREALRREVARDPARSPWLEAALRTGWYVGRIEELLWKCVQAHGELRPAFDPAALERALAAFPTEEARLQEGLAAMRRWGLSAQAAKAVGGRLWNLSVAADEAREHRSAPSFVLAAEEIDLEYLVKTLPPYLPQPGPTGAACAAAVELAKATPSLTGALAQTMLGPLRRELARHKRAAGQYDFDDMLTLVDDALKGPRGAQLARALRERWSYALIDEFQDTDETQWSIFRRAFFERHTAAGAELAPLSGGSPDGGPGTPPPRSVVCLVGDPKQSIYRFRGADVETYARARDDVARSGGERVALDVNYRATPRLVEATNALFAATPSSSFFTGAIAYEPVACGRPDRLLLDGDGREPAPLHAFRLDGDPSLPALASRIGREARAILDPARPWRFGDEPVAPHDVYVLTRTALEGRIVGAALRSAGVPHAFFKEEGLFQTDEAREIRSLLMAVADPGDRALRLAAWLTPFFALPIEDAERARDLPASHPYVARLHAWKALADAREFERLFDAVVCESGILRREIFFADGERDLTNTLHVLELLLEHARRTRATLRDLIHALTGLIEKTRLPLDLEGNVQRLESERRSVQIMTIHKAKGLEAAIVFLAGGWSPGGGGDVRVVHEDGTRVAWVGKAGKELKDRIHEEERQEDQRLMYVALTRAKGRVYVPCLVKNGAPYRLRGAYEVVNRRIFQMAAEKHPLLSVEDVSLAPLRLVAAANDAAGAGWEPPQALLREADDGPAYARLREARAGALVTSYTRLRGSKAGARSAWADEPEARRARKAEEAVDAVAQATLRSTRASGVFVHEVLERVALASFGQSFDEWRAKPEVAALLDEAIAVHRVDPAQREHAEHLVWAAYTTRLALPSGPPLARIAGAARVVREMEFTFPVADARVFVRGSLDLAFEHEGRTFFVDWKTDELPSYAPAAVEAHVRAHYEEQVRLYALAVVKLLGLRGPEDHEARFGGILYVFLRGLDGAGAGLWSSRPGWGDVLGWDEELRARRFGGGRS